MNQAGPDLRARIRALMAGHGGKFVDVAAVAGSRLFRQGVLLIAMAIAARVLGKELLGVWALINIVIQFGALLSDGGISTFVIREKELQRPLYATAFYGCVLLSIAVTAVTAAIVAPIAGLLGYADYKIYFVAAAAAIVPMGINAVLQATLRRDRRFVAVLSADVVANTALLVGVVWMLLRGDALWSLIVPVIASASISCVICGLLTGVPVPHIDRANLRKVADYSLGLVGFSTVNFWARNADHVLIGRFLGAAPLGIYSIAYRIMTLPLSQVNTIAITVALPYLAPHQDNPARLRGSMRQILAIIGAITAAPMVFVWLQRVLIVELVLGSQWERVADLLWVLIPIGLFQTFVSPLGLCFQISGKTRLYFVIGMVQTVAALIGFVVGVWLGSIDAVVWCYAVATLIASPVGMKAALQTVGSGIADWLLWCAPYLACLPACWVVRMLVNHAASPAVSAMIDAVLVAVICGGVAVIALSRAYHTPMAKTPQG